MCSVRNIAQNGEMFLREHFVITGMYVHLQAAENASVAPPRSEQEADRKRR